MPVPFFLILAPLLAAVILLIFKNKQVRFFTVIVCAIALFVGCLRLLLDTFSNNIIYFKIESHLITQIMLLVEICVAIYLIYIGIKNKKFWIIALSVLQTAVVAVFEFIYKHSIVVEHDIFIDKFSVIMALIVGFIGGLISVYALGYMEDFHHHFRKEVKDNRHVFFFLIFVFLSAMFGVVFSNNLLWLYFFWEITTVCSFLLIGYKGNEESKNNSLKALQFNLIGGLAFAVGIVYLFITNKIIELDKLMAMSKSLVLLPVVLISFAGLTKSAQLPFSGWLLGAMVAPTPVSALLHSSTMVKAGVYIIVRLASLLQGTTCGFMIALVGGITFLITTFLAVSQSDAKKVLAYSTIANLGLIVLCAGVGTYEAVWAAVLLIIFHAVAKCLLFLCVGVIEHKIHSRNIEDMSGLIITMPKLSIMLQIGMSGMFLAPFGMLISKWAALQALVDYNPLLAMFVVFGGAVTLFFWVKWMGRLLTVTDSNQEDKEEGITNTQWFPLVSLSVLTVAMCGLFNVVANFLIEPYIQEIYGTTITLSKGNLFIMSIMLTMVLLFPLSFLNYGKRVKVVDAYLGGANTPKGNSFYGSLSDIKNIQMKSYYLEKYFNEKKLLNVSIVVCIVIIIFAFIATFI